MVEHDATNFAEIRRIRGLATLEDIGEIAEKPWAPQTTTAHHHAVAARFTHHSQGIPGLPDVAVSEDRDAGDRSFELGNGIPIGLSGVEGRRGTGMESDRRAAFGLGNAARVEVGEQIVIDSHAEFNRDGNLSCLAHGSAHLHAELAAAGRRLRRFRGWTVRSHRDERLALGHPA